jgi:nitroreductase
MLLNWILELFCMDVFECMKGRRSIRAFTSAPVKPEHITQILDAGSHAPSAGNIQDWRFVVVKDRGKRIQLAEASMSQMWIADAPVMIVVCTNMDKISERYGDRGRNLYSIQDTAAAIQNMLLAAHALGLASCWIGSFSEDTVTHILRIPEDVRPVAILPIGYPSEKRPMPKRFDLYQLAYSEEYGKVWSKQKERLHSGV